MTRFLPPRAPGINEPKTPKQRAQAALATDWRIGNRYPGVDPHLALARDVLALLTREQQWLAIAAEIRTGFRIGDEDDMWCVPIYAVTRLLDMEANTLTALTGKGLRAEGSVDG